MTPLFGFRRAVTGASSFFPWMPSLDGIARFELDGKSVKERTVAERNRSGRSNGHEPRNAVCC